MENIRSRPRKHRKKPWQGKRKNRRKFERPNRGHSMMHQFLEADDILTKIAGKTMATRSGFVKMVWDYVKRNNLQKPGNGRIWIPNRELAELFGVVEGEEINGFMVSKHIESHLMIKNTNSNDKKKWFSLFTNSLWNSLKIKILKKMICAFEK